MQFKLKSNQILLSNQFQMDLPTEKAVRAINANPFGANRKAEHKTNPFQLLVLRYKFAFRNKNCLSK
jgi:hypothetical protein